MTTPERGERGKTGLTGQRGRRGTMPIQQLGVYLLVVSVGAYGLFEIRQVGLDNDRASIVQRQTLCERSVENREALRQLTKDTAMLLRDLVDTPGTASPEVRKEVVAKFEKKELEDLPSFTCPKVVIK